MFIDWYGYSFALNSPLYKVGFAIINQVMSMVSELSFEPEWLEDNTLHWEVTQPTEGGTAIIVEQRSGMRVKVQPNNKWVAVDLSGKACQWFRSEGQFDGLLERTAPRASRIDIAADVRCDNSPTEVASSITNKRMKITSIETTVSGESVYVGSRKSERHLVIYRYAEPHPRAALLRFELRFSKRTARIVATQVQREGTQSVGQALLATYHCLHPVCIDVVQGSAPAVITPDARVKTGRYRWLLTVVPVSIARAIHEREITLDWIVEEVCSQLAILGQQVEPPQRRNQE